MNAAARKGRFDLGGAIAQLGERLNGIQKVSGSIPLGSTKSPLKILLICGVPLGRACAA
jgi:hypothetical protein